MKQTLLTMTLLLAALAIVASGCAAPGLTKKGVHRRHMETFRNDVWQMQDDVDSFLMIDRPSRLSPMMVR